jgi:hypothetical protein
MSQRIVRIQTAHGETIAVRGKLADMIYWIARNKEKIDPIHQGELSFNWSESDNGENGTFRPAYKATMASERLSR